MNNITKYVGFDVSNEKIAVAVADEGRGPARYLGEIPNQIQYIRKVLRKIGGFSQLEVCYEAGPSGYVLKRQLESMGVKCIVVAPSLIPKQPGNRVKTDKRDAVRLAELLRAGELTEVWTPGEEDEALRDLVRAREDAKEDLLRAKHRVLKFLQRHGIEEPAGVRPWSTKYCAWLRSLQFESTALQVTFDEYRLAIEEIEGRLKRIEDEIHRQAESSVHAPVIRALQTLRGVKEVAATTLAAEVGYFSRFVYGVRWSSAKRIFQWVRGEAGQHNQIREQPFEAHSDRMCLELSTQGAYVGSNSKASGRPTCLCEGDSVESAGAVVSEVP